MQKNLLTGRLPSLDGWRALCIVLVLGAHCRWSIGFPKSEDWVVKWLFDGNMGVRFFFVISGFLITHLLLHEYNLTGSISLSRFYMRRALRILPVYLVYLLVIFLFQAFTSWHQSLFDWIANLTFTTNYFCASEPTRHLWSLAVEEQFYLLWPFLLVSIGLKENDWKMVYILGTPIIVAPICRIIAYKKVFPAFLSPLFQSASFLNNFDSLAIGCVAAILLTNKYRLHTSAVLTRFIEQKLFLLGLALILIPYLLQRWLLFAIFTIPFGNTSQALGFAILLLQSVLAPHNFKPLNWPVVKFLGVLSYSIYIWHYLFASNYASFRFSIWFMTFPGWLLAACLVGTISYYGLEKPLIGLRGYFRKTNFASSK